MDYCSPKDVHDYGIPAGSVPNPARQVADVDAMADTLTLGDHGFDPGDALKLRAGPGGALPAPLLSGTTYYALPIDENVFQVAASVNGPAINLTTTGTTVLVLASNPYPKAIHWASRILDDMIPAHAVPFLDPLPEVVRITCAELAGWKLTNRAGSSGSQSVQQMIDFAQQRLARWAKGISLRDANATPPTNVAIAATAPYADPQGWRKFGVC